MRAELGALEDAIGYRFKDRGALVRALTHRSHVHEQAASAGGEALRSNEQFEFLGDAVLGFLSSEWLVRRFPEYPEGRLSKLKAFLVSATHLYEAARKLDLGRYLQLSRGEEMTGGRAKRTLLGDAMEALIAAIYLDGGLDAAREFLERFVLPDEELARELEERAVETVDFRSALQELTQARRLPSPRYAIVAERGPEHSKTFTVEVRVGRDYVSQAEGYTKKGAAQKAAREIYEQLSSAG